MKEKMRISIEIPERDIRSLDEYAAMFRGNGAKTIFGKRVTRAELIRMAVYLMALGWERGIGEEIYRVGSASLRTNEDVLILSGPGFLLHCPTPRSVDYSPGPETVMRGFYTHKFRMIQDQSCSP